MLPNRHLIKNIQSENKVKYKTKLEGFNYKILYKKFLKYKNNYRCFTFFLARFKGMKI